MHINIVHDAQALTSLRSAWENLAAHSKVPMQHFIWTEACAAAFTPHHQLFIVTLLDGQELKAVLPLVQRADCPYLELLGNNELQEPIDAIYADRTALWPLAKGLLELGHPLLLRRIPLHSSLLMALENTFQGHGVFLSRADHPWSWTPLDPSWINPETHLNAKHRADYHRKLRMAKEIGPVTSEIVRPTPQTLHSLLEAAFAVESSGWKGRLGTAMALDPIRGPFYRRYASSACEQGILRLCFLRIGNDIAAMQMAMEYGDEFWLFKIGYDERFARCSPGTLLLRESLHYAAAKSLHSFHILGSIDPRLRVWAPLEQASVIARAYPLGLRGVSTFAGDMMKWALHKVTPRLNEPLGEEALGVSERP